MGVSYRGDVGDTRFTPVEKLVRLVKDAGANTVLHDPYVSYWREIDRRIESCLDTVLSLDVDVIVISAGHSEYKSSKAIVKLLERESIKIYDTIGLLSNEQISLLQEKHEVSVLGRGDL